MTNDKMVKAFNEWMRRFIEEPDRFSREFQAVSEFQAAKASGSEPDYGECCASYLQKLAGELHPALPPSKILPTEDER